MSFTQVSFPLFRATASCSPWKWLAMASALAKAAISSAGSSAGWAVCQSQLLLHREEKKGKDGELVLWNIICSVLQDLLNYFTLRDLLVLKRHEHHSCCQDPDHIAQQGIWLWGSGQGPTSGPRGCSIPAALPVPSHGLAPSPYLSQPWPLLIPPIWP